MQSRDVEWAEGRWTRDPAGSRSAGDALVVRAVAGSDYWRTTHYGFVHDDGHGLLGDWPVDAAVEVTFDTSTLTGLYDQAGLLLWVDETHWVKAGIEISDGVPHLGAVVTNEVSDWSLAPVPDWTGRLVTVRASRGGEAGDAVTLRARADDGPWRTLRVAPFATGTDAAAQAGPMLCAPLREGLEVRFTRWALAAADVELHAEPPAG
ncbi:DUF1349 domain-containing protein [Agromyces endophyticus]|uniref:DUF1349 domain-containing protein n=1 Tax=Agromyces sp. H17E-10 TaxID=2932244 RepID=UPI001FCFCC01|nr:DUF1349 domain-containing protein [Agromyces sp. H17E-10]UOQ90925.1 DUF1349 domain-containing protein [Agromyces sp. H17E-10]